ncbi:MAG: hypothetical protein ACREMY_00110 [bacterium]
MDPIANEAERLEKALKKAVRLKSYPPENLPILHAAALEVCELDFELNNGPLSRIWWCVGNVIRMGLGEEDQP